jgi:hypothetical protein
MSFAFDLGSNEDVRANADRDLRAARGWKHALRCPLAGRGGRAIPRLDPIRIASLRTTMGAEVSEQPIFKRILCGVDGTPATLVAVRQALRLQDNGGRGLLSAVARKGFPWRR